MSGKIQVILQARTGSKRLYGKSLIPIIDEPLQYFAIKGYSIENLVTTIIPKGKEDDYLAQVLKKQIEFFGR